MKAACRLGGIGVALLVAQAVGAQVRFPAGMPTGRARDPLDSLVAHALEVSPRIVAAERRVEAAQAAVGPAGALDDPMVMAGVMYQPFGGAEEDMAMRVIGASQRIPYPGKRGLGRSAAVHEFDAARAELDGVRGHLIEDLKAAYYALAFLDRSTEALTRTHGVMSAFLAVSEARYGAGTGSQADVLKARIQIAQLAEDAAALDQERRSALAHLDALLDRPSDAVVAGPAIPERIARAAVPLEPRAIWFTSAALGAPAAGSPLPPLSGLQEEALQINPALRAHAALIAAQDARVALARKSHLPDFDFSLQYGQRAGLRDLFSAEVSVPIPIHKGERQDLAVRAAEAELAALHAEHAEAANALRAEVATACADTERARTQLALLVVAVLPQGRAAVDGAAAGFQSGRADLLTIFDRQTTLLSYETAYQRALTDFATRVAALERLIGRELL